jgi:nucleoside transporter
MSDEPEPSELLATLATPSLPPAAPPPPEPPHAGAALASLTGAKLALAMFLHHFSQGSWVVTLGSYVKANTGSNGAGLFAAGFVGIIYGAGPLGGMVSPFLTGVLADRFFATERLMAALSLLGALALYFAWNAHSQAAFYASVLAYFLCYLPSFALCTSMCMHHLRKPAREFPVVRACGTMGWIAGGVFVGWLWPLVTGQKIESTIVPLQIGMVGQVVTAAFCLWLPHTPPANGMRATAAKTWDNSQTLDLVRQPLFIALMALAVLAHIPSQFYYAYSNVFLNWTGMEFAAAKMTLGQVVEVCCMLLLPLLLARISIKSLILVGLGGWLARFVMLAIAAYPSTRGRMDLVYAAIMLHGVAFTFVTISLQLEVDRCAGHQRRATAQGLLSVAMQGFGCFLGAELAGLAGARILPTDIAIAPPQAWSTFWLLPAGGAAVVFLLAAVLLPRDRRRK